MTKTTEQPMSAHGQTRMENLDAERTDRMLRELASDLAYLVASGDLTEAEANEWLARKQDQWRGGDR